MATDHGHDPHAHGPINHETTDIHLEGIGKIAIGFVVFMALVAVAMYGTFVLFNGRAAAGQRAVGPMVEQAEVTRPSILSAPNDMESMGRVPAGPKLLTNEAMNLRGYRETQTSRLNSYGWVDKAGSVVHLPIARAIELTVERGLPAAAVPEPVAEDAAAGDAAAADAVVVPQTPPSTP